MSSFVALCAFAPFILWLVAKDAQRRNRISASLWIPLTWAVIIGSRPVSFWFGADRDAESAGAYLEDKLLDKALFLVLIASGLIVLMRRCPDWRSVFRNNKWVFVYFLYLLISVLWSEEPFISFKRWIKDAGNVVMALVILSEEDPLEAVRAFLARCASLLVPLSVLVIRYYPHVSRHYDTWTNQPVFVGLATDKNTFGMALFVSGLSLFWLLLDVRDEESRPRDKTAVGRYSVLLLMTVWLFIKAHSATAVVCTALGSGVLLAMRVPAIRNQVKRLGTFTIALVLVFALLQVVGVWSFLLTQFAEVAGRDASFHGRAEIWQAVLKEDINPLIGVGFYSFWGKERNQRISEDWYYNLGEAHNGYIETYLNNGLIGVLLLIAVIAFSAKGIKRAVLNGSSFGVLRLAFLVTIVIYNVTESAFDRLVPVWFILLLMMMEYPRLETVPPGARTGLEAGAGDSAFAVPASAGSLTSSSSQDRIRRTYLRVVRFFEVAVRPLFPRASILSGKCKAS